MPTTTKDASKSAVSKESRSVIRWEGVAFLGGLCLLGIIYLTLFFDSHLKQFLELYGTAINGAQVQIGSVRTNVWKCRIELKKIQIANNARPMRNFLEIDRAYFDVLPTPLLSKKLIINDFHIDGVRIGSNREQSGLLPPDPDHFMLGYGLQDRASLTFYPNLRQKYQDNLLGRLGQFSVGLEVHTKFDAVRSQLRALKGMDQLKRDLDTEKELWQTEKETLVTQPWLTQNRQQLAQIEKPSNRAPSSLPEALRSVDLVSRRARDMQEKLAITAALMHNQDERLQSQLRNIEQSIAEDVGKVRSTLGLPNLDAHDLTTVIFGPRTLNYLEKLAYWIDFTRRRMPKGSRQGLLILGPVEQSGAMNIHFGKMSSYPAVLIRHGSVSSEITEDPHSGMVRGTIEGITSDPPMYGMPATIHLEADFPGQRISDARLDIQIDHTSDLSREKLTLGVGTFPVAHWVVHNTSDLSIAVGKGTGQLLFQGEFDEEGIKADWKGAIRNIDYEVTTPYHQLQEALQRVFNLFPTVDVSAKISGPANAVEMQLSSEMGEQVASALRTEFKHSMDAIDDSLRRYILDEIDRPREQLTERLAEFRAQWQKQYQSQLRSLDSLRELTDQAKANINRREKTASRK